MKPLETYAFTDEDGDVWSHEMLATNTIAFDGWYRRAPEHQSEEWRRDNPNWDAEVRKAKDVLERHGGLVKAVEGGAVR